MFFFYTVLYSFLLPFFLPKELMKRPKGARMAWLAQKLGRVENKTGKHEDGGPVWVHAVSVGEVMAAVPFVESLKQRGMDAVISTITETGRQVALKKAPGCRIIYLPFDLPFTFKKAAASIKPGAFVIMETELWPNAIKTMNGLGIPVFIVNGRISGKSASGYRRLRFFFRHVLSRVSLICVQEDVYAKRAVLMGAEEKKILVLGNFKFEVNPKGFCPAWAERLTRPVIAAGSTHAGEEDLLVNTYKRLTGKFPSLSLALVPRHPERVPEVEEIIKKTGLGYVKSSEAADAATSCRA